MKINYDAIRDTLLYLEENLTIRQSKSIRYAHTEIKIEKIINDLSNKYEKIDIFYSIEKLNEVGYIATRFSRNATDDIFTGIVTDITWDGYDFLENIRQDTIWEATKKGAKKIGSQSISTLSLIAKQIITSIVTNPSVINKLLDEMHSFTAK